MTGYESKRAAAQAKTIDEVNWVDHEPNGLVQPAQEPVGTFIKAEHGNYPMLHWHNPYVAKVGDSLYTAPPQRPWVGLTDKNRMQILDATEGDERGFVMKLVEDKLKEKNT